MGFYGNKWVTLNEGKYDRAPIMTVSELRKYIKDKSSVKNNPQNLSSEDITKSLKEIVCKYNSDPQLQKSAIESANKYINEMTKPWNLSESDIKECFGAIYNKKKIVFSYKIFEEYDTEVSYEIFNGTQEERLALNNTIYDIARDLEKITKCSCSTGDGDEGCIYVSI